MRITNNIIQRNALASLQVNARAVHSAQKRVSSGLRIEKASDDPVAASGVMEAQGSLSAIGQYRRNVQSAQMLTQAEETALSGLGDLLGRARELAVSQADSLTDSSSRQAALKEVDEILKQVIQIGNHEVGGRFLFGGIDGTTPPVSDTGAVSATVADTNPLDGTTPQPVVHIAAGFPLRASHNAKEVFEDTGVIQVLQDFQAALTAGDDAGIRAAVSELRDAHDGVQNLLGEVGAWSSQLDVTTANLDALELNLKTFKADLEEADLEEAVTELIGRQNAYQAAMLATSRVMGMTLADYLR